MLDDAFKLTIDQLYPQPQTMARNDTAASEVSRKGNLRIMKALSMDIKEGPVIYSVPGYSDTENMWYVYFLD
jgi:hypothetical protein